jgi:hypothetical protein
VPAAGPQKAWGRLLLAEREETSVPHDAFRLPMTIRAKLFRRRAEECSALAQTMIDQLSRRELERTIGCGWLMVRICLNTLKSSSHRPFVAIERWNLLTNRTFSNTLIVEAFMGRGLLLWLIGIPIPIILLIWLFGGLH